MIERIKNFKKTREIRKYVKGIAIEPVIPPQAAFIPATNGTESTIIELNVSTDDQHETSEAQIGPIVSQVVYQAKHD